MNLSIRPFAPEDFPYYKQWLIDKDDRKAIGGVDNEWLNFVLNDTEGIEYAVCLEGDLVCVLGIVYPKINYPFYTISNIIVHSNYRSRGIGQAALKLAMMQFMLQDKEYWKCYVHQWNKPAIRFFESLEWHLEDDQIPEDGMFTFLWHPRFNGVKY